MKRMISICLMLAMLLSATGCGSSPEKVEDTPKLEEPVKPVEPVEDKTKVEGTQMTEKPKTREEILIESDFRIGFWNEEQRAKDLEGMTKEKLKTLVYNEKTQFPDYLKDMPKEIMEKGKNPGLGVRDIHASGITGKGVTVAIIDQPIYINHPEYEGKIIEYKSFQSDEVSEFSMHGSAVASILVGENTGTAPGAKMYYAGTNSEDKDAKYFAAGLNWVVDVNETLPEKEKIKIVSVSAQPSGISSPFKDNNDMWDKAYERATQAGIFILDCTPGKKISMGYLDMENPDDAALMKFGMPEDTMTMTGMAGKALFVPASFRTTAEQFGKDDFSYAYWGKGGLSWAIPYAVGVMALGMEIKPELTGQEAYDYLFETSYVINGYKIINPTAFIEKIKSLK